MWRGGEGEGEGGVSRQKITLRNVRRRKGGGLVVQKPWFCNIPEMYIYFCKPEYFSATRKEHNIIYSTVGAQQLAT